MKTRVAHPAMRIPSPHISTAVVCDEWVFVSGQGPLDMATLKPILGSVEQETRLTLANIQAILVQAGCLKSDIVKCTCYLATLDDFCGFNATYQEFFDSPIPPARSTVQAGLLGGIKIEIDVIARRPER
jgi:2-iminobutanoate/2-iminopropanoate deaminase